MPKILRETECECRCLILIALLFCSVVSPPTRSSHRRPERTSPGVARAAERNPSAGAAGQSGRSNTVPYARSREAARGAAVGARALSNPVGLSGLARRAVVSKDTTRRACRFRLVSSYHGPSRPRDVSLFETWGPCAVSSGRLDSPPRSSLNRRVRSFHRLCDPHRVQPARRPPPGGAFCPHDCRSPAFRKPTATGSARSRT